METNQLQDIKQTIMIDAPIQKVWKQVSTSEGIAAWFMPNDFVLKEGHEFHIQSPFGPSPCKVLVVDEPNRISFSWDEEGWFVDFLLKAVGEQTEFTLVHGGWKDGDHIIAKVNQKSSAIRDIMNMGWMQIINKIKAVIEG